MPVHLSMHSVAHPTNVAAPQMDTLMVVGFLTALLMLVCLKEQNRAGGWVLAFAIFSVVMAIYAFCEGVWPLGLVQIGSSISTVGRWRTEKRKRVKQNRDVSSWQAESRITRLFGPAPSDHQSWSERQ